MAAAALPSEAPRRGHVCRRAPRVAAAGRSVTLLEADGVRLPASSETRSSSSGADVEPGLSSLNVIYFYI